MKKPVEKICRNCSLYLKERSRCGVNIIDHGQHLQMEVEPTDKCIWEELGIEVQQIRMWSDGKNGYVEYPTDFCEEENDGEHPANNE